MTVLVRTRERLLALSPARSAVLTYLAIRLAMVPVFVIAAFIADAVQPLHVRGWPLDQALSQTWDGEWYGKIVHNGYPSTLPRDASGTVVMNNWAFFPVFPYLVRAVMLTGLHYELVAPILAFLIGAVAAVLVSQLVRVAVPHLVRDRPALPLLTVAAVNAYPAAATMQVAYTESIALALVAAVLILIKTERYLWAILPMATLGFTRAVALPMTAVVLVHGFVRLRALRGDSRLIPTAIRLGVLLVVTMASSYAWPEVVQRVTGVPGAYFLTNNAWRPLPDAGVPFGSWWHGLRMHWGVVLGTAVFVVMIAAIVWMTFLPALRAYGIELQVWSGAYLFYLVAASGMYTSIIRYALLAIVPVALLVTGWRDRRIGYAAFGLLLVSQVLWILGAWGFGTVVP